MAQTITASLTVNGKRQTVTALPDTPLLWVLREELKLTGTKFGCGAGQCGACMVHLDGKSVFSCLLPIKDLNGRSVTTIEGLSTASSKKLQQAWITEQVPQCGYCLSGWMMTAAALLRDNPKPTDAQIRTALAGLKCRCGTHMAIMRAVKRASTMTA